MIYLCIIGILKMSFLYDLIHVSVIAMIKEGIIFERLRHLMSKPQILKSHMHPKSQTTVYFS